MTIPGVQAADGTTVQILGQNGPAKWTHFYLYVIIDVFSRYVVGWMVAEQESTALAKRLIEETCERQGIKPGQLTLHADRGPVSIFAARLHWEK